jgi:hypothetical protein
MHNYFKNKIMSRTNAVIDVDTAKKILNQKGLCVVRNLINKNDINLIKYKILKNLKNPNKILVAKNIKKSLLHGQSVSTFTKDFKYNLNKKEILNGYKSYAKLTNRILLKDPLLNYRELNKFIFNKKIINICEKFFRKPAKLGFIAFNCDFKNNLPKNDINLFHTDDSSSIKTDKKNTMLKIAIPFHLKDNSFFEYRHIGLHKKKLKFFKQYFSKNDLDPKQKKFIINPRIRSGDAAIFDPNNFFHCGEKTKYPVRIVLTIVYIQSKCYLKNKAKNIKIHITDFNGLDSYQKRVLQYISIVK